MKKLVIFDMDGTVYLGDKLIDGAKECFKFLKENKIDFLFLTNNSSHDVEEYLKKVNKLGIKCDISNFYSSIETTVSYLNEKKIKNIFVLGNECLKKKLSSFHIYKDYKKSNKIDAVVCGFNTELVYEDLKNASLYLQTNNIPFIATNGDYRCPIEDGLFIPDCGGMIEWLRLTTGKKAKVLGKPYKDIIEQAIKKFGYKKNEVITVGDRLYTDIEASYNAKVDSIAVLSGECSLKDIKNYPHKPTYILKSIKELPNLLKKI